MNLGGEVRIEAPRERVWAMLNDPEVLRECIPGCEALTSTGDQMTARVTTKIGPVKATFDGVVRLVDVVAPVSYRIEGEGKGGIAGFAAGGADVTLAEAGPNATVLSYVADARVGGKLAQIGGRLIESTAKKLSDQFFAAFAQRVEAGAPVVAHAATVPAAPIAPALPVEPAAVAPAVPPQPAAAPMAGGFASFASAGIAWQVDAALGSPTPSGPGMAGPSQQAGAVGGGAEAGRPEGGGAALRSVDVPGSDDRLSPYHDGEPGGGRDPNAATMDAPPFAEAPVAKILVQEASILEDVPEEDIRRRNAAADQGGILSHAGGDMAVGAAAHTTTGLDIPSTPAFDRVSGDRVRDEAGPVERAPVDRARLEPAPMERAEEQVEMAAAGGFLGGPVVWGLIALAVVIVLIYLVV